MARKRIPKWNAIWRKPILGSGDYDEPNVDAIYEKIKDAVSRFMRDDLPVLTQKVSEGFKND